VQQERAELVADPERAVRRPLDRLDVEVAAGQQPVLRRVVDDRERDPVVGVAQRDEALDLQAPAPADARAVVRCEPVDPQQEVGRVVLGAEAVVRLAPERPVVVGDRAGDPRDRLAGEGRGLAVGRSDAGVARRRPGLQLGGRVQRAPQQDRLAAQPRAQRVRARDLAGGEVVVGEQQEQAPAAGQARSDGQRLDVVQQRVALRARGRRAG
jgi:hypothetical protein